MFHLSYSLLFCYADLYHTLKGRYMYIDSDLEGPGKKIGAQKILCGAQGIL